MSRFAIALLLVSLAPVWASEPSIFIDNVNGAPTPNASGSPEGMSPVAAAATCHTNGVASTTIQWPANGITLPAGNDCTGANNCGILFLGTASGRQFTEILSVTAGTVVVEDTFNIPAGTPVNCAVGGRLTNVELQLAIDMKADHGSATHGIAAGGWQIFIVNSGVNYTWTATRVATSDVGQGGGFYGVPSSGVGPTIDCNFDPGACLSLAGQDVVGIIFRNTSGTKTGTIGLLLAAGGDQAIRGNTIGGDAAATAFETGIDWNNNERQLVGNIIRNNTLGLDITGINAALYTIAWNVFESNTDGIISVTTGSQAPSLALLGNIFWDHSGVALRIDKPNGAYFGYNIVLANTFHDNGTAVDLPIQESIYSLLFASNLITNNTTGVSYGGAAVNLERESALIDFNCYGQGAAANGADISGFIKGPETLSVDPQYVDAATGDFTPQNTDATFIGWPPGLDSGTPLFFPGTATISQPRCGAIQPLSGGAGFSNVGI